MCSFHRYFFAKRINELLNNFLLCKEIHLPITLSNFMELKNEGVLIYECTVNKYLKNSHKIV